MSTVLQLTGVSGGYGSADVIRDVNVSLDEGEIVAILGANGAGKTTTLRAVSGMIRSRGVIALRGEPLSGSADRRARRGIGHVPQGRGTLTHLTVHENLWAGASRLGRTARREGIERWLALFPRLADRLDQSAGNLSGGEQQLLAFARTMISGPEVVLLDEPSLGLAPQMVAEIFGQIARLNAELGTAFLVVEQNASVSLSVAHRAYVLESGQIIRSGPSSELLGDSELRRAYLGI